MKTAECVIWGFRVLKGPKYLYSRMQGVYVRYYYYDLGKYPHNST